MNVSIDNLSALIEEREEEKRSQQQKIERQQRQQKRKEQQQKLAEEEAAATTTTTTSKKAAKPAPVRLPKDFVCEGCKKPYALKGCFANHVLVCQSRSGFIEMNAKLETLKRGLEEEATERKDDVKKIKQDLEVVFAKIASDAAIKNARSQDRIDWGKNQSRDKILLFFGMRKAAQGESKINVVSEFLKNKIQLDDTLAMISDVSFLTKNKKNNWKVEFKNNLLARKIVETCFNKKILNVTDYVTPDTTARRKILSVYANNLRSENVMVTVPEFGSRPHLLFTNIKENWSHTMTFVDAVSKYGEEKFSLDSVFKFLKEKNYLEDSYKNVLLSYPSSS
jgi:hypothetical protein